MSPAPQSIGQWYNAFAGANHNKALLLYAGWAGGICSYMMYKNYHPSLPEKVADESGNNDFAEIIAAMEAEEKKH